MCEGSGCYHSLKGRKENPTTVSLLKIKLNLIQRVKRQLFRNMISDKKRGIKLREEEHRVQDVVV